MNINDKGVPPLKVGALGETASNLLANSDLYPGSYQCSADNSTTSKRERILDYIRVVAPLTILQARQHILDLTHLAHRCLKLREPGAKVTGGLEA